MPTLLPPPEFRPGELAKMGLTGTCEMQICRSAGPWSLGTPGKVELSIQNAYLKGIPTSPLFLLRIIEKWFWWLAIQLSEHFVYIENQFFITSWVTYQWHNVGQYSHARSNRTVVNDIKIENNIGNAIVHRIMRAHRDGTPWKCCIIIPLLPGFTFPIDHSDASAVCWVHFVMLASSHVFVSRWEL